jgi:hypothetical protein
MPSAPLKVLWSQIFPEAPFPKLEDLTPDQLSNLSIFFLELEDQRRGRQNVFLLDVDFNCPEQFPNEYKDNFEIASLIANLLPQRHIK